METLLKVLSEIGRPGPEILFELLESSFHLGFELRHELIHVLLLLHAVLLSVCISHLTLGFFEQWRKIFAFETLHAIMDPAMEILHDALQLSFSLRWVRHGLEYGHVRGPGYQLDLHFHFAIVSDDNGRDDCSRFHARDG